MKVLVTGLGNIGTTLANILLEFKTLLNIKEVYLHKNLTQPWEVQELHLLEEKGGILLPPNTGLKTALQGVSYVFDCTDQITAQNIPIYETADIKGVCLQGGLKNINTEPFVAGFPHPTELPKITQTASCNVHGGLAIIRGISGGNIEDIKQVDFVFVRRSEDIGKHEKLVSANVVARHRHPTTGTQHAADITNFLKTRKIKINVKGSDITTPSQMLHTLRFNMLFKDKITPEKIKHNLNSDMFISTTGKFDSNAVFETGRRYGLQGRLYSQAIIIDNNLLFDENALIGWAFIPQEGATILSTIEAFIRKTNKTNTEKIIKTIADEIIIKKI